MKPTQVPLQKSSMVSETPVSNANKVWPTFSSTACLFDQRSLVQSAFDVKVIEPALRFPMLSRLWQSLKHASMQKQEVELKTIDWSSVQL
jgi:hypothetical protein